MIGSFDRYGATFGSSHCAAALLIRGDTMAVIGVKAFHGESVAVANLVTSVVTVLAGPPTPAWIARFSATGSVTFVDPVARVEIALEVPQPTPLDAPPMSMLRDSLSVLNPSSDSPLPTTALPTTTPPA